MVKQLVSWQCEICAAKFNSYEGAAVCEGQEVAEFPGIAVGDFVTTDYERYGHFGWFNGDPTWAIKKSDGLHNKDRGDHWSLIYVVTAITVNMVYGQHEKRYHLATRAMLPGTGYDRCYSCVGHYPLLKISPQLELDSTDLIGMLSEGMV